MKLRFKLSSSQKFLLDLENTFYGEVKSKVLCFISSTYDENIQSIKLSLNGKDPLEGDDSDSLTSLGVCSGDLLTILRSSDIKEKINKDHREKEPSSSKASHSMEIDTTSNRMGACGGIMHSIISSESKYELPDYVHDAFSQYEPSKPGEVINLLVHLIFAQNGFYLANNLSFLSPSWKDMVCTIKYVNPSYGEFNCDVVIVTMGNVKQVLVSFPGQASEISVKIQIEEYVDDNGSLSAESVKKFDQLSFILKSKLLYPLQVTAHGTLGIPAPWHLAGLPQEIMIKIASFLKLRCILNIGLTCKSLQTSMNDPKIWFLRFKKDFPDMAHESDTLVGANWKAKYKSAYMNKKKTSLNDNKIFVVPQPHQPGLPRHPHFPYNDPFNPHRPQPHNPFPYNVPEPDPFNPFIDPDGPYFQGGPPAPGFPGGFNPVTRPRRPRGPRIDFI